MSQRREKSKRLSTRHAKSKPAQSRAASSKSHRSRPPTARTTNRRTSLRHGVTSEFTARVIDDLLAHTQEIANVGSWEYRPADKTFLWSNQMFRMLGLTPGSEPVSLEFACQMFHPEDRARVWKDVETVIESRRSVENEVRFIAADGSIHVFVSRAIPAVGVDGSVLLIRGISQDVTRQKSAEEKQRKSEALLAQAETLANLGSWEFNFKTGEVCWSAQLYRILGFDPQNTSPTIDVFSPLIDLDERDKLLRDTDCAQLRLVPIQTESRWRLPDGAERILLTRAVPVYGESGDLLHLIGTTEDITEIRFREEQLRRLSQQLLNVRDEEQRRVARDLHESVVQSMAAMKMQLGFVKDSILNSDERAAQLIHSTIQIADETISQARTLSHLLHPPLLDEAGLYPAVRWYARGFAERSSIATQVEMDENFGRLPQETELAIFRIVQEALTNVHRHSGSPDAIIRVRRNEHFAEVDIEDHGCGMARSTTTMAKEVQLGVGTAGMRERVTQLHGTFEIKSATGKGTIVFASLPLPSALSESNGSKQEKLK
jgi:signal transduction histidine kinase